jgi:hypothetical protein
MGPRIAQNIQNWRQNREERDRYISTAETLGRYLANDPQGIEMFGEKLSQAPKMSSGQVQGLIGGVTSYLNERHLRAAEQADRDRVELLRKQMDLQAGEAAERLDRTGRMKEFSRRVSQHLNPPLMFKSAAGPRPEFTGETIARYATEAGLFGDQDITNLINTIDNNQSRSGGLGLGQELTLSDGSRIIGTGRGQTHFQAAKNPVNPNPVARTLFDDQGNRVGKGFVDDQGDVHMLPESEEDKVTPADQMFMTTAPSYLDLLEKFKTKARELGEQGIAYLPNDPVVAAMKQLTFDLASARAKLVDPGNQITQGEVEAAAANLFPWGRTVSTATSEAAAEAQKDVAVERIRNWSATHGGRLPPNLPDWVKERLKVGAGASAENKAAPKPGTRVPGVKYLPIITPDGKLRDIPAEQYDEALNHGFKSPHAGKP